MKKRLLKISALVSFVFLLFISSVSAAGVNYTDNTIDSGTPIYRLYNEGSREHLYTRDVNEYNALPEAGWTQEGIGWTAPTSGEPVYRLYNVNTGYHLYSKDMNEVSTLLSNETWSSDNDGQPVFYSGGLKSVYRLYHEELKIHHLTTDEGEYINLGNDGWRLEGSTLKCLS